MPWNMTNHQHKCGMQCASWNTGPSAKAKAKEFGELERVGRVRIRTGMGE